MSRAKGRVCATCNAWKESLSNYQSPDAGECRLHPVWCEKTAEASESPGQRG